MKRFGPLVLASFLLASVAWSPPAMAAFPGKNGRIVFAKTARHSTPLYSVNPNGSGLRRITHGRYDSDPSVAPDGRRIAFGRGNGIFAVNASGRHLERLTSDGDSEPAFSGPRGRRIAFTHFDSTSAIWLMRSDGSNEHALTDPPTADRFPAFSPDGQSIYFIRAHHDNDEIWKAASDGSGPRRVSSLGSDIGPLAIAPDGNSIVYEHLSNHSHFVVGLMRANGTLDRNLGPGEDPAFSPNGKRIVFTRRETVYTMNRHGNDLRRVTPHSWNTSDPEWAVRTGVG